MKVASMKAAVFHAAHDIRVEDVPVPRVKSADDVLIEVAWSGICGTDLHEYTSGPIVTPVQPHPLTGATLPQVLGHEFSGRVAEVGDDVHDVRVGDRVAIMPAIVCGRCYMCRRGMGHLCELFACTGLSAETGALSQFAVVKEYQVSRLPDSLSDEAGALIEPAAVAAYGVDRAGVDGGDIVLVTGAGPVGCLSALYASAVGAGLVVIAEPNPNRAELARALDVGPVVDPTSDGFADELAELTGGAPVDMAAECSGTTPGLATCITHVRRAGRIVQTGLHTKPATLDAMALSEKDLSLLGSWCYRLTDWPRIIRLASTGRYPVEKVLTRQIKLGEVVTQGFDALVDPLSKDLKILVRPI
jgi:(R,R)-butanediol dehydrogenase/meso-butanediol dehydrogenase/diacetyl reductase